MPSILGPNQDIVWPKLSVYFLFCVRTREIPFTNLPCFIDFDLYCRLSLIIGFITNVKIWLKIIFYRDFVFGGVRVICIKVFINWIIYIIIWLQYIFKRFVFILNKWIVYFSKMTISLNHLFIILGTKIGVNVKCFILIFHFIFTFYICGFVVGLFVTILTSI